MSTRDATLVFLVKGDPPGEVLLGLKKTGFGEGKWNGFGGKIEDGESVEQAAVRELEEETGIKAEVQDLARAAHLTFFFPARPEWDQVVHAFLLTRWKGEPVESAEMKPAWFRLEAIPFEQMWQDDAYWLARALAGERIRATFTFTERNDAVDRFEITRM